MRVILPCAALALAVLGTSSTGAWQQPAAPLRDYAAVVEQYRSGNANEAVVQMVALGRQGGLFEAFSAFVSQTPSADLLTTVAALHTEAGLRSDLAAPVTNQHLDLATALVEIGMPPRMRRLGARDLRKMALPALPPQFRRLWFLTVISLMENGGRMSVVAAYLENARALFPRDPEFLLLSGIAEEMLSSNLLQARNESDRRRSLGYSEVHLRASLELAPDRLETRLRLGRVLWQRNHADEARPFLTAVSSVPDERLSYLAALFLGGLEDSAGNTAAAARWYAQAAARMPSAQSAQLAASELQHRAGKRHDAAESAAAAAGSDKVDPWWAYFVGEHWRIDLYLNALRRSARS